MPSKRLISLPPRRKTQARSCERTAEGARPQPCVTIAQNHTGQAFPALRDLQMQLIDRSQPERQLLSELNPGPQSTGEHMPGMGEKLGRASMFAGRPMRPAQRGFWSQLGNQVRAAAEGVADSATFGLDDQAAAGISAAGDWLRGKPIGAAYRQRIAEQHASDAYDAQHFGAGRTIGTIGSIFIPGAEFGALARVAGKIPQAARLGGRVVQFLEKAGAAKVAQRIPQVTRLSGRERAAAAVVGAGGGVVGQGASDIMQGRRSSLRDYAASAAGGSAEALAALRGNPGLAAAAGGATTSLAQDALNGRQLSIADAAKAAAASRHLASAASKFATSKAAQASIRQKEKLGELGSKIRTLANLDWTISTKKQRFHLDPIEGYNKGYTYPDQRTALGKLIESKFGPSAELSRRQTQAYLQLGPTYRVDHFLPSDVGSVAGFALSQTGHNAGHQQFQGLDPSGLLDPLRQARDPARFAPGFPTYFG